MLKDGLKVCVPEYMILGRSYVPVAQVWKNQLPDAVKFGSVAFKG